MPTDFPYLRGIKINKVRHLGGFTIPISVPSHPSRVPVHLLLTGRNGAGKTSLIQAAFDCLLALSKSPYSVSAIKKNLSSEEGKPASTAPNDLSAVEKKKHYIRSWQRRLDELCGPLELCCSDPDYLHLLLHTAKTALVAFYDARRSPSFRQPDAPRIPNVGFDGSLDKNIAPAFVEYLAHLKIQRSLNRDEGKPEQVEAIDAWFRALTDILCKIFGDPDLRLEFNPPDYSFTIVSAGKRSPLIALADGYAALLEIVADLILKMQDSGSPTLAFDRPGIVFIDELETHLHLELQRLVLPILTSLFPKIQFIVTTHSPFVLSSIDNALVFDLDKQNSLANADEYSYDSLAEGFFNVSPLPASVHRKFDRFSELAGSPSRSDEQNAELHELYDELSAILPETNPELFNAVNQLALAHNL